MHYALKFFTSQKLAKRTKTNIKNHGAVNFTKGTKSRNNYKQKLIHQEGITNVFQRSVKDKIYSTLM